MTIDTVSFEQEIRNYLLEQRWPFNDQTRAYHELDFTLLLPAGVRFHLEAKEKQKPYNPRSWPEFAPEPDLFILDDLTVRKCLAFSPRAGVVVKDAPGKRYLFFSVVDLALMPRQRVNRAIEKNARELKGKWLIDLRNGNTAPGMHELMGFVDGYIDQLNTLLFEMHACYGDYAGENIGEGGVVRQPSHWDKDVRSTR